jgi:hypothetical protein
VFLFALGAGRRGYDCLLPYIVSGIAPDVGCVRNYPVRGGGFVYNVAVVRQLCVDIAAEQDSLRVQELLDLLHAVLKEDQEEIRMRMVLLARKYADVIAESKAAD